MKNLLFIIQLFYCSSANYMILTMFQNNLVFLPSFSTFQKHQTDKISAKGPFIFERIDRRQKQEQKKLKKWSADCHLRYIACLRSFKRQEWELRGREAWAPFRKMAQFIKLRNSNQCRIHHKKMLGQHGSIQGIIAANSHLIRRKKMTFSRYTQELTSMLNFQEVDQDGTNKRSRMLQSLIVENHNPTPPNQTVQRGQDDSKKGEDIIPTDVAYQQQPKIHPNDQRRRGGYLQFLQQMPPERLLTTMPQLDPLLTDQKKREWQQCHQLFLAWTSKLQNLMS